MSQIVANFSLELKKLTDITLLRDRASDHAKQVQLPKSAEQLSAAGSARGQREGEAGTAKLSGDERLFLGLYESPILSTILFEPKRKIITAGKPIEDAYLIVDGSLLGSEGSDLYRLGPGSVLGLAEGIINKPSKMNVITVSHVQAKIIPLHKIDAIIGILPTELRAMLMTIIKRTLALPQ